MNKFFVVCLGIFFIVFGMSSTAISGERQLTFDTPNNHQLDNNLNFSPDGKWLAYDTRASAGGIRNTLTLEKVHVDTKEIVVIHAADDPVVNQGPGMGAVSYFPTGDKVIAIHGPATSTGLTYEGFRRFGAMFSPTDGSADIVAADARDVTEPFTPGALRGGTHRHEPTGDEQFVGFTYNDQVMAGLGKDLRTIGIIKLGLPVAVDHDVAGENHDGVGFTVLLVKVKPQIEIVPDSDDVFQASDDSFVGENGYDPGDGSLQRARAFIGRTRVTLPDTSVVTRNEVYIVDIPDDITVPGPDGPLEGTATTFPMPPAGTVQRRLTFSDTDAGDIVRSSKDGSRIAFSKGAPDGTRQIFMVSPLGGAPVQATSLPGGSFKPWWHPSGDYIISLSAGSIWGTNVIPGHAKFGESWMITDPHPLPSASPDAIVFSNDGNLIGFNRRLDGVNQVFVTNFFVPEPSTFVLAALGLLGALAYVRRTR